MANHMEAPAEAPKGAHHYDPDHGDDGRGANGDGMAHRSCTDIFCLLIFFAFLGGMSFVSGYGYKNGNPKRLTHGYDYDGNLCGVDAGFEDKPFLYYCPNSVVQGIPTSLNFQAPVCVAACPVDPNITIKCMGQSQVTPVAVSNTSQILSLSQSIIDTTSYPTTPALGMYCLPDLKKINAIATASNVEVPIGLRASLTGSTGPVGKTSVKLQQHVGSLRRCYMLIIGALMGSVLLGYVYLFFLRVFAKPLIYLVLISLILSCFCFSGFFLIGEMMPRPEALTKPTTGLNSSVVPPALAPVAPAVPVAVTPVTPVAKAVATVPVTGPAAPATPVPKVAKATPVPAKPVPATPVPAAPATPVPAAPATPVPATPVPAAPATPVPAVPVTGPAVPAAAAAVPTPAPLVAVPKPAVLQPVPVLQPARRLVSVGSGVDRRLMTYEEACDRVPATCQGLDNRWKEFGGRKKWEASNPFYNEHMAPKDAKMYTQVTGAVWAVLGVLFLILLCCCHSSIDTACGVVKASCECLFAMPCLLVMPAIEMVIKAVLISGLLTGFCFLVSSGELDTKTYARIEGQHINGLRRHFKYTDEQYYYITFYVFGIFWLLELANAMGAFVTSFAVVGWYYTPKGPNGGKGHNWCGVAWGYVYALTFHLGSLALGSFFIAVFRFVRLIMMIFERQSNATGNPVVACLCKLCICCITCFQKFINFINKNAYIDICITSNNFCGAAKDVMEFLAGQGPVIAILHGACFIFSIAGTCLIAGATSYTTYTMCMSNKRWSGESSPHHVESPRFVAGVVFVLASFVAHGFMAVFDHTADTLLYTFCWNKSKGHNTVQKYAPDVLSSLCGYKPLEKPKPAEAHQQAAAAANGNGGGGFFSSWFGGGHSETAPLISKAGAPAHGAPAGHH